MCVYVCVCERESERDSLWIKLCACVFCHDKLINGWFNHVYTFALVVFTVYDTGSGVCVCLLCEGQGLLSTVNFNPHQDDL